MYMSVFFACMYVCPPHLQMSEEDIICLGSRITDDCELLCGGWELNPSAPQEQCALFTMRPSL